MKTYQIALLPGDGIGPEIIEATRLVANAITNRLGINFDFIYGDIGAHSIDKHGVPLTVETIRVCKEADAILFGAIGDPKYDLNPDLPVRPEQGLLKLRKELGLFANIRPVKAFESLLDKSPLKTDRIKGVDFVIYRELTGGIYFGDKGYLNAETAYDHCVYRVEEIDRILHKAFIAARRRKNKVTLVDKANVMETSRLWRKRARVLSQQYPQVELDYLFVDNAAMQLILQPSQFDVIVTSNMFGDILSDEASVITGSIGLLASASIGRDTALFEPVHGSFPQAKGKGVANPVACIYSFAMLLNHLGETEAGNIIDQSIENAFEANISTTDINPNSTYSTLDVAKFIAKDIVENNVLKSEFAN